MVRRCRVWSPFVPLLGKTSADTLLRMSRYEPTVCSEAMRRTASRGMIQVGGVTYRVERVEPHHYVVYRLLDDAELGTFQTLPALRLHPVNCEIDLFRDVVRAAMRSARTSAVMHAAPVFQPDEAPVTEQRSPSTLPPRRALA
jgi:hypothetical protein